ncbi:hypothetical protein G7077_11550 [Sphingomonas piscis]|uniref:Uncharacterized protein n=1 Tax=Sphingomonas piscis TaxID=2714943 RepID=A0A6G7YRS7_9SPHN|nr:hypothetical protein [Sphingomonas piscis]QIK79443.1 hypothetical protein G7077_11550 [Sphingomonas piscis]
MRLVVAGGALALFAEAALSQPRIDHQNIAPRPGSWSYAATASGSEASFRDGAGQTLLIMRCTRQTRRIAISARTIAASSMTVWSSTTSRSLPATYNPSTGFLTAELPSSDALLDGVAFSRGHFTVTGGGSAPLVVANWPEPARAIEDCRN